jgi:hypothetical protein
MDTKQIRNSVFGYELATARTSPHFNGKPIPAEPNYTARVAGGPVPTTFDNRPAPAGERDWTPSPDGGLISK